MTRALFAAFSLLAALAFPQSKNTNDLGAAKLLVASRDLNDSNFAKTVILLVHYDDDKALGLILNRRTEVPVSSALEGLKAARGRTDAIYLGGPVDTSSVFGIVQSAAKVEGASHIFDELYLVMTKALLEQTIAARRDPDLFHIYLGYAGWTNEQLKNEVELGAWFVFRADAATVFDADPDTLWSRLIRKTEQKMAFYR